MFSIVWKNPHLNWNELSDIARRSRIIIQMEMGYVNISADNR